jgi:glycosyltransferase involved in cell wall biosynthesis
MLEAMASGLICVASNAGGIPSIIKDKENGFLFESKNYNQLESILSDIIDKKYSIASISEKAQSFVKEFYYPARVANTTIDIYKTIVSS